VDSFVKTPKGKSDILLGDVIMNIKVYCSCGQPFEISLDAGGQRLNCPSCKRELTIPQMVQNKPNQPADAESQKLFIRFRNVCENLKQNGEMTLWLIGVAVAIITGMWLIFVLLTK
jgi:hypothetical protein